MKADLDVMLLCQMGDEAPRPSGVDRARVLTAAPPEMSVCVDDAQAKALASCDQIAVLIAPNP
ncbi:MAG: hypothetical protein EP330_27540 [Deltaproteobacteria bacterium]|nr:MAG: hypothetical protein EP330_27540 [Deltaproteobacteria bacterium]